MNCALFLGQGSNEQTFEFLQGSLQNCLAWYSHDIHFPSASSGLQHHEVVPADLPLAILKPKVACPCLSVLFQHCYIYKQ